MSATTVTAQPELDQRLGALAELLGGLGAELGELHARVGSLEVAGDGVCVGLTPYMINEQGEVEATAAAGGSSLEMGTTIGTTSGIPPVIKFKTHWGVNGEGKPFYSTSAVPAKEAAIVNINEAGELVLTGPVKGATE